MSEIDMVYGIELDWHSRKPELVAVPVKRATAKMVYLSRREGVFGYAAQLPRDSRLLHFSPVDAWRDFIAQQSDDADDFRRRAADCDAQREAGEKALAKLTGEAK